MTATLRSGRPRIQVVGAGICGVACAGVLQQAGLEVVVSDRGRAVGGRMASRRLPLPPAGASAHSRAAGHVTDIGASYFTVRDVDFTAQVRALELAGVVRPWTDAFQVSQGGGLQGRRPGPMRYRAPAGLRSVVQALAEGLPISSSTEVGQVLIASDGTLEVDRESFDAVALCMPGPQADRLLAGEHRAVQSARQAALDIPWEPVIAVSAGFEQRCWEPFDGVFVNDDPILTWIADDGARRGNQAPVLVAHLAPPLAADYLDDPQAAAGPAIEAMRRVLSIDDEPTWVHAQRWTFARPTGAHDEPCFLDREVSIGLAGDAWAGGPRVEAAWCSGRALGQALATRWA